MTSHKLRSLWKRHHYKYKSKGSSPEALPRELIPKALKELICEAKTREGTLCISRDLYSNGRCRLHGGLSTGPKTLEGKQRSAANVPGKTYEDFLKEKNKG